MSKIRLSEGDLRRLIHESIEDLINEGFLGGYFNSAWDAIKDGVKNDIDNVKNNYNTMKNYKNNKNYDNIINFYGSPCINKPQNDSGEYNDVPTLLYVKDRNGYEYILGENELEDGDGNVISDAKSYYTALNNNALYIKKDNNPLYNNVVAKFIDGQTGSFKSGVKKEDYANAIKKYRQQRNNVWENFEDIFINDTNNQNSNNNNNSFNPLSQ